MSRQIFVLLGLLIVAAILVGIGIFGFCIGIFFTIPFLYSSYYVIYNEIIGSEHKSEIDQIGSNVD